MTDKQLTEVIEGNKSIYKFIGYYEEDGKLVHPSGSTYVRDETLEHLPDWNTLMPVVEKMKIAADELWQNFEECEPLHFTIDVWKNEVKFVDTETGWWPFPIYTEKDGTVLQNTWQSVVDFIQWYNQNKQS